MEVSFTSQLSLRAEANFVYLETQSFAVGVGSVHSETSLMGGINWQVLSHWEFSNRTHRFSSKTKQNLGVE